MMSSKCANCGANNEAADSGTCKYCGSFLEPMTTQSGSAFSTLELALAEAKKHAKDLEDLIQIKEQELKAVMEDVEIARKAAIVGRITSRDADKFHGMRVMIATAVAIAAAYGSLQLSNGWLEEMYRKNHLVGTLTTMGSSVLIGIIALLAGFLAYTLISPSKSLKTAPDQMARQAAIAGYLKESKVLEESFGRSPAEQARLKVELELLRKKLASEAMAEIPSETKGPITGVDPAEKERTCREELRNLQQKLLLARDQQGKALQMIVQAREARNV